MRYRAVPNVFARSYPLSVDSPSAADPLDDRAAELGRLLGAAREIRDAVAAGVLSPDALDLLRELTPRTPGAREGSGFFAGRGPAGPLANGFDIERTDTARPGYEVPRWSDFGEESDPASSKRPPTGVPGGRDLLSWGWIPGDRGRPPPGPERDAYDQAYDKWLAEQIRADLFASLHPNDNRVAGDLSPSISSEELMRQMTPPDDFQDPAPEEVVPETPLEDDPNRNDSDPNRNGPRGASDPLPDGTPPSEFALWLLRRFNSPGNTWAPPPPAWKGPGGRPEPPDSPNSSSGAAVSGTGTSQPWGGRGGWVDIEQRRNAARLSPSRVRSWIERFVHLGPRTP